MDVIGQTLVAQTGTVYRSDWFPRGGNSALFALEVVALSSATVSLGIETKNLADKDSLATPTAGPSIVAAGIGSFQVSSLLELVRFTCEVKLVSGSGWAEVRALPPSWLAN